MIRFLAWLTVWTLMSGSPAAWANDGPVIEAPDVIVDKAAAQVLKRMDGQRDYLRDNPDALYALVEEIFLPYFDRAYAAARVLGRHRRDATASQRRRFTDALYNYVLRSYGEGLLEFTSDRLEILPFRGMPGDTKTTIRTKVFMDDGKQVPVNYSLRRSETGPWRVWDVTIEGISYVKNFQDQLDAEIRANGLDAVIERLENEARTTSKASSS